MKRFAALLEGLLYTPARNGKLRLLVDYLAREHDPHRGWALAALTGTLDFPAAKPAAIRALAATRVDPVLFAWSYDFVGDLAETTALIWPEPGAPDASPPRLAEVVEALAGADRAAVPALVAGFLDRLDATGRWALLKLITGGLRVGVSAGLAKTALAEHGGVDAAAVEETWHAVAPPYGPLFDWLDGRAPRPLIDAQPVFRPLMLAHPLGDGEIEGLDLVAFVAEWKWDGIRVQLVGGDRQRRLYARSGDDISAAFPDVVEAIGFDAVLDGELLVVRGGMVAPFNDLQQRLNRTSVAPRMLHDFPAHVRLYDMLFEGGEDLRPLPFAARRDRLEAWYARCRPTRMDVSPLVPVADRDGLATLRATCRDTGIEGLMLKRRDSAYVAGRPKGLWYKWKRDPHTVDAVLMYAQRGHGKRSSYYSDYTFGLWRDSADGETLVPVGKAYFGFTDAELVRLDRWVRENTVNRFGPVREVAPRLVVEIAFDAVQRSGRHKSGVALRFPRFSRIRWDKPAAEADRLPALEALIEGQRSS